MSGKPAKVPDAWDEDWEAVADKEEAAKTNVEPAEPPKKVSSKVTKAQRRAQHAEFNRQLWTEAEEPQPFHFLESRPTSVPLKSEYKTPVTLLSRKPQIAQRPSATSSPGSLDAGVSGLDLNGDEEDDDEDEGNKKEPEPTPEERQAIQVREREEKQRKYEEVRERLFGSSSTTGSGASSPGSSTTPPPSRQENRWKGKNRQNGRGDQSGERRDPPSTPGKQKQLYDPGYSPKPSSGYAQKKDGKSQRRNNNVNDNNTSSDNQTDDTVQQRSQVPVRSPRGPDGSGRGGLGFSQGPGRGR